MSLSCKLILNDLKRLSAVAYRGQHAAQFRPQDLQAAVATDDGRVRSLACQRCSIQGNVLIEIVEIYSISVALKGLSRSPIRKNDIMVLKFNMQIFKNV